jgi:hypothetical protein
MTVREANLTAASSAEREPEIMESGGTARLHLTLAITDYDHVRDLVNGVVRAEGVVLTAFVLPVEEIFYRFIKNREWDISEMSFGKFIGFASQGNSPFVGIPVFPSRVFRHSAFYLRTDRGISRPKDLEGKRVGIPEWAQTAGIYARGFLSETAGVDLRKIQWVQAGMNEAGREEKVEFKLPRVLNISSGVTQASRRCCCRERSTRRFQRVFRMHSKKAAARSCDSIPTIGPKRCSTTPRPEFTRSCMWSQCAGLCLNATRGSR